MGNLSWIKAYNPRIFLSFDMDFVLSLSCCPFFFFSIGMCNTYPRFINFCSACADLFLFLIKNVVGAFFFFYIHAIMEISFKNDKRRIDLLPLHEVLRELIARIKSGSEGNRIKFVKLTRLSNGFVLVVSVSI